VRIEELINTFTYDYPQPSGDVPFSVNVDVSQCPWQTDNRLVRIGLKGREVQFDKRPVSNLVFLLDVSGSMNRPNKLPLLVKSMKLLVDQLGENDHVAITVYAGASGLVLPPTSGENKGTIMEALDRLRAGGSTNGGAGIELAYRTAQENFVNGGVNRVILATDGDFNVGVTNRGELTRLIEEKAKAGVFLTVLGFGMGNLQDATLEQLADKGNGNYAYIDGEREARRVLVEQIGGTLVTIAKDVKIQVEFNPAQVAAYRLVGYENRMLAHRDFNDDTKDAGEIGAGHTVTAFYEIVPAGADNQPVATVGNLRYQRTRALADEAASGELMTVKLRYKEPDGQTSKLIQQPVKDRGQAWRDASDDFRFAASVATFGMILRGSQFARNVTLGYVAEEAQSALGDDPGGYRREFVDLVKKAQALKNGR
jgi:Ca-activated chloride channel family protein